MSVGTELLLGQTVDTNAAALGRVLAECGIDLFRRTTIGDNLPRVVSAFREAASRAEVVVAIGGLGPTEDDVTRQAVAEAAGVGLVESAEQAARLRAWLSERGRSETEGLMRQAFLPEGAEALDNPYGTAPGIWLVRGGVAFAALPGPPREFTPMLEGPLRTRLSALGGTPLHTVVLRAAAVAESVVEGLLGDLVRDSLVTAATYAKTDEVHVRLASKDPEALRATADEARRRLSPHVYGSGRETLAETVVSALRGRRQTLATAESCTGGLIGARLTDVPGASEAFLGGIVAYSNGAKQALLGVPSELLAQHGAVSAECAEAMAVGARKSLGSDWALSVTGIAGPGGGSDEKPVGLVWHGLAGPDGASSHKAVFGGGRDQVRARASALALELLRRKLGG